MNRFTLPFILLALATAPAAAQAKLSAATIESLQTSLSQMADDLGGDEAREAISQKLLGLAVGPAPGGVMEFQHLSERMTLLAANPEMFLEAIRPYEGMTAKEIMAVETP